jgi:hypothetical protein
MRVRSDHTIEGFSTKLLPSGCASWINDYQLISTESGAMQVDEAQQLETFG